MPFSASGGAKFLRDSRKVIRFAYHGCKNRPFFHLVVMEVSTPIGKLKGIVVQY